MTKRYFIVTAAAVLLLGAGCSKLATPAEQKVEEKNTTSEVAPQEAATSTAENTEQKKETTAVASGTVHVDIRKDTDVTPAPTPAPAPVPAPTQKPIVKSFNLSARQWSWVPGTITVKQGDTVHLSITTLDVNHGFFLAAYDINKVLTPGKTEVVEFVADKKGSFTFLCSVQCGSGHSSMSGTLIVE